LPAVAATCAILPDMTFVLNHLGLNAFTEKGDVSSWRNALIDVASSSRNVYAKLGAIEEWLVEDPSPFLDVAIRVFGYVHFTFASPLHHDNTHTHAYLSRTFVRSYRFDRVLYESNWFVSSCTGHAFDETARHVMSALLRARATPRQIEQVFWGNAMALYCNNNKK